MTRLDRNADSNRERGHQRTTADTRSRDLVLPHQSPLLSAAAQDYGSQGWGAMTDLTAVSLFGGIGGIDEALRRAGVHVAATAEIDPACREILARHFPETALFADVTEVTGDQLRAAGFVPGRGILAAGWPCQGNSVAGRRGGMADPRSGLWRHVVRLLAETRPRWFLGENVPGLLSINEGRDFRTVLADLDDLGYGVAWRVLDAQWFGVPQRRRRVFLAGCLGDPRGPVQVLLEPEGGEGNPAEGVNPRSGTAAAPGRGFDGTRTIGTLGTVGPGGGWRLGADEAAAGQLVTPLLEVNGRVGLGDSKRAGTGIGAEDGPMFTLQAGKQHGVAIPIDLRNAARGTRAGETAGTGLGEDGDPSYTLSATGRALPGVAMAFNPQTGGSEPRLGYGDKPTALQANQVTAVHLDTAVRRLTPRECERLQGFPDDWTAGQPDSTRYRQLGNAVAVPVVEWIARRVVDADGIDRAGIVRAGECGTTEPAAPREAAGELSQVSGGGSGI